MPTDVLDLPTELEPRRKHWTRSEYDELSKLGLLNGQHVELIQGELVDKMGKNRRHTISVTHLLAWLIGVFGAHRVQQEAPIDVAPEDNPTNVPEPDLIVLSQEASHFLPGNPRPANLHLVIEVADSSLGFDLTTKAALYARAGILDYWVYDIPGRRMIVHRHPEAGRYTSVAAYNSVESISPLAAPHAFLAVNAVFPF